MGPHLANLLIFDQSQGTRDSQGPVYIISTWHFGPIFRRYELEPVVRRRTSKFYYFSSKPNRSKQPQVTEIYRNLFECILVGYKLA